MQKGLEDLMLQAGLVRISQENRKNRVDKRLGHKLSFVISCDFLKRCASLAKCQSCADFVANISTSGGAAHNSEKCGKGEQGKHYRGQ